MDEGEEIKAGENVRGELVGEDFDVLGRVEVSAKVEVRQVKVGTEEEERSGGPPLLRHGIVVRGGRGGVVDGTEGPGSFNELNKLVIASLQPLQTVGASKSGSEGEGE